MKLDSSFLRTLSLCEKRITFPTLLTLLRIILVPVIIAAMVERLWCQAFVWFVIASLTDLFDGMLARRWKVATALGACLDPVADKILLVSCFSALAFIQAPAFMVPRWFVMLILCKELIIVCGALFFLVFKCNFTIRPTWTGKLTTVVQIAFISWLFFCYFFNWMPIKTYYVFMVVMVGFTVAALSQYISIGLRYLFKMVRS